MSLVAYGKKTINELGDLEHINMIFVSLPWVGS